MTVVIHGDVSAVTLWVPMNVSLGVPEALIGVIDLGLAKGRCLSGAWAHTQAVSILVTVVI